VWRRSALRPQLQLFFGGRFVGRGLWLPRSPDVTPARFFLWRLLKERVYSNNPRILEELKHGTKQTVANTDPETLRIVARSTLRRADVCLGEGDGHWTFSASAAKLLCKFLTNKN
jgi:hypothetical protein